MSGEWASPESWSHLFQTAGVPAAILVFILALFAVFAFLALWWTVGPNGLVRDIGDRAWKTRLLNTLGWCFAEIGSFDRARATNESA
jgi:hypothetical protein